MRQLYSLAMLQEWYSHATCCPVIETFLSFSAPSGHLSPLSTNVLSLLPYVLSPFSLTLFLHLSLRTPPTHSTPILQPSLIPPPLSNPSSTPLYLVATPATTPDTVATPGGGYVHKRWGRAMWQRGTMWDLKWVSHQTQAEPSLFFCYFYGLEAEPE